MLLSLITQLISTFNLQLLPPQTLNKLLSFFSNRIQQPKSADWDGLDIHQLYQTTRIFSQQSDLTLETLCQFILYLIRFLHHCLT
jgi:hypothetical protein